MPNSMRPFPVQNFKVLMMNLLMLLNMLNQIFMHTIISIKWPKTVGNTCRLFFVNAIGDHASDTFQHNVSCITHCMFCMLSFVYFTKNVIICVPNICLVICGWVLTMTIFSLIY